jgi:hypothetical protein
MKSTTKLDRCGVANLVFRSFFLSPFSFPLWPTVLMLIPPLLLPPPLPNLVSPPHKHACTERAASTPFLPSSSSSASSAAAPRLSTEGTRRSKQKSPARTTHISHNHPSLITAHPAAAAPCGWSRQPPRCRRPVSCRPLCFVFLLGIGVRRGGGFGGVGRGGWIMAWDTLTAACRRRSTCGDGIHAKMYVDH